MTQFPEVTLAREAELCFANVALVTDYDVGVDDISPVSHHEVLKVFGENIEALRNLLFAAIPTLPGERGCTCGHALVREPLMSRRLVRVELSFVTEDDVEQLGDRIREATASIVGRDALDEFRVRTMSLDATKKEHLRSVD